MSRAGSRRIRDIEQRLIGRTEHRVLLVEGPDDIDAFSAWLAKRFGASWESQWVVAEAGKKTLVLDILEEKPEWLGVIDRDEWSEERLAELEARQNNLWALPRYCIENYLIVPEELWQALPPIQQEKVEDGFDVFQERLISDLERWVKHGALWSVVNPLWEGLRSLGFKEALLDPQIVTNDEAVIEKLTQWHDFLEPDSIYQEYQSKFIQAREESVQVQLSKFVHGKKFYEEVVNPALNDCLGQRRASERQQNIVNSMPVPDDLQPLWLKMGLVAEPA